MSCAVRPISASTSARLPWSRKRAGMPKSRSGTSTRASRSACAIGGPDATGAHVVLDGHDAAVVAGHVDQRRGHRLDPAGVDDRDPDALAGTAVGHLEAGLGHRTDGDERARRRSRPGAARRRRRRARAPGCRRTRPPWGTARRSGASSTSTASRSSSRSVAASRGAASRRPGTTCRKRHVPHAVVARPVVTGDPRAVEHERHAALVQRDVHQHLVEGTVEERRVDRHDRVQPADRQAGGRRGGVLLGDADVEHAVGVRLGELVQADRDRASRR